MRLNMFKSALIKSGLAASVLLVASGAALGQSVTAISSGTVDVGASLTTAALTLTAGTAIDAGSITITGVAAPFSVDASACNLSGLAAGASCTINVTFAPTATGPFSDPVTVSAKSATVAVVVTGSPVTLSGTGYTPTVAAANPLVFTDPGAGVASAPRTVILTNAAVTQVTFTTVISNAAYSVATGGTCPAAPAAIVLGGATPSCTLNLVFTPPTGTVVDPSATLTVNWAVGAATPTQVALISLVDTDPSALTAGAMVEVELTAVATSVFLNDGSIVPMWGYRCSATSAACSPLNPTTAGWSPVVITALAGQNLAIDLTNQLSFAAGSTVNTIPTSLTIVGQLGGGLGTTGTSCADPANSLLSHGASCTPSPAHAQQGVTWATPNTSGGANPTFVPPPQPPRLQSFATEVAAGTTTRLIWNNLKAGTYLIESGTHPSIQGAMGLYGILVVTTPPTAAAAGVAYGTALTASAVNYNAEIPLLLSEIDPVQNTAVQAAVSTVGFSEMATSNIRDYVASVAPAPPVTPTTPTAGGANYSVGDVVSILGGGGTGATAVVATVNTVVTTPQTVPLGAILTINVTSPGSGYTSSPIATAVSTTGTGAQLQVFLSMSANMLATCTGGAAACYPPVVNYTPLYYLINGVAFDKTHASASLFPALTGAATTPVSGNLLVRLVNAGLRMHVPSIVGSTAPCTPVAPATTCTGPGGFALIAEDGNVAPGVRHVQSEVFMAAGKTYDVMVNVPVPAACTPVPPATTCTGTTAALPIYDRELSLSGNAVNRDAGMLAYIGANGATAPAAPALSAAVARADTYNSVVPGVTLNVLDPSKGLIANDTNVSGVTLVGTVPGLTLYANGTFTYTGAPTTFTYCANGAVNGGVCSSGITATVTLAASNIVNTAGVVCTAQTFASTMATYLLVKTPGVLAGCTDGAKLPLQIVPTSIVATGLTVVGDANGGFTASAAGPGTYTFTYQAKNSQGKLSAPTTATVVFPTGSGLVVNVLDGSDKVTAIADYRWVIEEDRTFYINPNCVQNPPPAGCPTAGGIVPTLGVNFHTSYMPFVAQGCTGPLSCEYGQTVVDPATGVHSNAVCDVGNGLCRLDTGNGTTAGGSAWVLPSQVHLDPTKRYYISVLPGDAAAPFIYGAAVPTTIGHGMGGAPIGIDPNTGSQQSSVTVYSQPSPFQPARLSVFVFEDDFPLNGEHDGGGGIDVVAPNEPGLGGFEVVLWDSMGGNGDFTGQMTHDMFNQPLSNALDGTIDPLTQQNACPISQQTIATQLTPGTISPQAGITGRIVTCPKYEADGSTLSPLAGQAVIANLMPGRFGVIATPAADRIARGEEWLQTNTLDGQKAHDSFTRIGEPSYFQEFGPASYHVSVGFANPAIINNRLQSVCDGTNANITGTNCTNTLTGMVVGQRLSRTPDERLFSSGSHDAFYWTQCFVSVGDPDGIDFAFTKCNADGTFTLAGLPDGDWRITTFDQWNDQLVDGLSTPVLLDHTKNGGLLNMQIAATQWQTNLYTKTYIDDNKNGRAESGETGIPFANVAVRLRDGSLENLIITDFGGIANFNETFPLFSWYTVETDVTRYKNTGTHVVYDAGGPADHTLTSCGGTGGATGYPPCGDSVIGRNLANTVEVVSLPPALRVPGAIYCAGADCDGKSMSGIGGSNVSDLPSVCMTATTPPYATTCSTKLSTGRIDPPWVGNEGWQGFPGQNSFIEFGKAPYFEGENGGIKGHVVYASTRPFDDPQSLVQTSWEPLVPHVTINLYQEGFASDGVTPTLTLVDTTRTTSFDDFAQGFHLAADGVTKVPNMNCPGQGGGGTGYTGPIPDLFYFSLYNQPNYLDLYQNGAAAATPLPYHSQFKCYDGMHNWTQVEPAPYDGQYQFPSVTSTNPTTGRPTGTNCKICTPDPVPASGLDADPLRAGLPILPPGKYVVEIVVPPGMELVKEEDKNILIGDNFIAPVTQQFGGLGNIFILPDQASVAGTFSTGSGYNPNNAQNPTQSFGASPNNQIVPGFVPEPVWPCVGEARIVPDFISLFPQSSQGSPFAGAKRNLCDRKEVTLSDQMGAIAKFFVYTSTHVASKFTGGITDDYTSEFDPFSPQFGEKFAPPDLPVSVKDNTGVETNRVYADHWGAYNGMTYSTWDVNPPNPTGYSPQMMVLCMNDPGPIRDTLPTSATFNQLITDPLFTPGYSQFCYELPFMPGTTQYLDTPVVPTSAFAGAGYNNVDCAEPDATPVIAEVDSQDGVGPWVAAAGRTLRITALGDQMVPNHAYSGPSATTAPFNQKAIKRHYGFGANPTVTIGGVATTCTGTDQALTCTVPSGVPACEIQQQAIYGGSPAQCGQLVITAGNGKQSIDAITVTIGGKPPVHVAATDSIQTAIDVAAPGDLIIIDPTCQTIAGPAACTTAGATKTTAAHTELLLMWKPVRLQGVGASSSILNANTHPAGKLTPWRTQVNCLFGMSPNGTPVGWNASCGAGWNYFSPTLNNPQVDRQPFESTIGWTAGLSGNMAEQLQEPSLMGALEGAGITVLSKGVFFPSDPFAPALLAGFPTGTVLFTEGNENTYCAAATPGATTTKYPSNFTCNPSSIDGLGITNSSQGGGGIFVHAWGHHLQIANNRVYNNSGTLSGGINVGQGEYPPGYTQGNAVNAPPGSCETSAVAGQQLPYCHDMHVNVHHNYISLNNSTGDELFAATPAGAGGVSICTGSDYYKFNYNWLCGNLSNGDGGGLGHLGFSKNGHIEHNSILFNQSTNPTIPTNGGGIIVMGTPDADPTCGITTDADCVSPLGALGPSDGVGPGLVINANLILGNAAESGSGGGIGFQHVNGGDVVAFPNNPGQWHGVMVSNNIIANNVAGWDGAGVSLLDSFRVHLVNNTIISNVTTASAGVLTNTLQAPLASTHNCPPGGTNPQGFCTVQVTTSTPQPAGVVSINDSAILLANLPATITCPPAFNAPGTSTTNGTCRHVSYPWLHNNVIYGNETTYIAVGALSPQYQQNVVSLINSFTNTPVGTVPTATATTANGTGVIVTGGTGACLAGNTYWDIGVRGDTGPTTHSSGVTLNPRWSVLSPNATGYNGNNLLINPEVQSLYCNGSRQPPEACAGTTGCGWAVPAGISDATVPNPIFNLTPVATVDEGNNWINLRWGPLSLTNPTVKGADGNYGGGAPLGNYALASSSGAIDRIPVPDADAAGYPATDFFGYPRPDAGAGGFFDVGAVESQGAGAVVTPVLTSITPNSGQRGNAVNVTLTGTGLTGVSNVNAPGSANITFSNVVVVSDTTVTATLTMVAATTLGAHNVNVSAPNQNGGLITSNNVTFTVGPWLTSINPIFGYRGSTVAVTLTGAGLSGATALNVSGVGVTAGALNVSPDGTTLTTNLTIASSTGGVFTPTGARNISVTTPNGGTSNNMTFTVRGPTLTSIAPTRGVTGTTVNVTLTGDGLTGATGVNMGSGVACTIAGTPTATTVNASCVITAAPSVRPVQVVTTNGTTSMAAGVTFTIFPPLAEAVTSGAFATATPDRTAKTGTITVINNGAVPATLSSLASIAVNTGTGTWTVNPTGTTCISGRTLAANVGSCTVNATYTPPPNVSSCSLLPNCGSTAHVVLTGSGFPTATASAVPVILGN